MKCSIDAGPFVSRGFLPREYFRHEVLSIPKLYPDTYLSLERRGISEEKAAGARCFQINLYSPDLEDLPDELFFDRTVNWHEQQFGRRGLIAAAGLCVFEEHACITLLQSDLCQQLFRHPGLRAACKTKVDNRFGHWYKLLLNAILHFAADQSIQFVDFPTADQILSQTRKVIQPSLFRRIYDHAGAAYESRKVRANGAEYWRVPVAANAGRIVPLETRNSYSPPAKKVICLFHDIEEDVDAAVSKSDCRQNLVRMLKLEKARGVRVTYNVLGTLWNAKAPMIREHDRHSLAFHSYDHQIERLDQLRRCRQIDLRVKGYRPPRSTMTAELTHYNLGYRNFEWLMAGGLGHVDARLINGIAMIPVQTDDHRMISRGIDYPRWEEFVLALAQANDFLAVGLHDCYAPLWIEHYGGFLDKLMAMGELRTCDEVLNDVVMRSAL